MVEGVWGVVSELADVLEVLVLLTPESSRDKLEIVLEFEVLGLLVDHLLVPFDTPHRHLDPYHHVQD